MGKEITTRRAIMAAACAFYRDTGRPITTEEAADLLDLGSRNTAWRYLSDLQANGYMAPAKPGKSRASVPVGTAVAIPWNIINMQPITSMGYIFVDRNMGEIGALCDEIAGRIPDADVSFFDSGFTAVLIMRLIEKVLWNAEEKSICFVTESDRVIMIATAVGLAVYPPSLVWKQLIEVNDGL